MGEFYGRHDIVRLGIDPPDRRIVDPDAPCANGDRARPVAYWNRRRRVPASARSWRIESTARTNAVGEPTAYVLVGTDTGIPYSSATYPPLLQAPFAQHPLWLTAYKDGERYAGGDYPFQGAAGDGLTAYASPAENVNGTDVVVWYTPAITHIPYVEEYPVMTTERTHFDIEPDGFFDANPALDAPSQ